MTIYTAVVLTLMLVASFVALGASERSGDGGRILSFLVACLFPAVVWMWVQVFT